MFKVLAKADIQRIASYKIKVKDKTDLCKKINLNVNSVEILSKNFSDVIYNLKRKKRKRTFIYGA